MVAFLAGVKVHRGLLVRTVHTTVDVLSVSSNGRKCVSAGGEMDGRYRKLFIYYYYVTDSIDSDPARTR